MNDLQRSVEMYRCGLSLEILGRFENHEGFDGVMLGRSGWTHHFELTYRRSHPVRPSPTAEDLLVFYLPERAEWERLCASMLAAGFAEVTSNNPYWQTSGRTFEDADGYRVVLQLGAWDPMATT